MYTFNEYVPANKIWETAKTYEDKGLKPGYVRGYNIEVNKEGVVYWMPCCYIHSTPEEYFNSEFYEFWLGELNTIPTGRICFRGYGVEEYSVEERDTFIRPVDL